MIKTLNDTIKMKEHETCIYFWGCLVGAIVTLICVFLFAYTRTPATLDCFVDSLRDQAFQEKTIVFNENDKSDTQLFLCDRVAYPPLRFVVVVKGQETSYFHKVSPENCVKLTGARSIFDVEVTEGDGLFIKNASLVACAPSGTYEPPIKLPKRENQTAKQDAQDEL